MDRLLLIHKAAKYSVFFTLSAVFLLFCFGCDNGADPPIPEVPDEIDDAIWPLDVGNEWVIDVAEWNDSIADWVEWGERYIVDSAFAFEGKRVNEIILQYFVEDTVFAEFILWWGNTTSGLYEYALFGDDFEPYGSPKLLFKHPATDGEVFSSYAPDPGNPVDMGFSFGAPAITVPAGEFGDCLTFQYYEPPGSNIYYYFKPDTGYIMMERYVGASLNKTRKLQEYLLH